MLFKTVLVVHIIVLGYWLGSELVINSTFRYVTRARDLVFAERRRLLDHVMIVDQHVRYALALQFGLGLFLADQMGYLPVAPGSTALIVVLAIALLALVEVTHRLRAYPVGATFARIDRYTRVVLTLAFVAAGLCGLSGVIPMPGWFATKIFLFGMAIACGLAIRYSLIAYFDAFARLADNAGDEALEARLWSGYVRSTAILVLLWLVILAITILSVAKPAFPGTASA
jgi:hypothetical protein